MVAPVRAGTVLGLGYLAAAVLAAGCSGNAGQGDDAREAGTALGSCTWPSSLNPAADASWGQCSAARAYLSCTTPGGAGEECLSNDPTRCPNPDNIMVSFGASNGDASIMESASALVCQNKCQPNEYGAECGGVGPPPPGGQGPGAQPPAGCRGMGVTPGGTQFLCCPCGS
ncbi:MAG TPA: hypothetical protein VN894_16370 [Polyangiaceae bacterium]|nr:hypothetical protein [Polyangiaceae bacterium]